jgi:hypothetical protein
LTPEERKQHMEEGLFFSSATRRDTDSFGAST